MAKQNKKIPSTPESIPVHKSEADQRIQAFQLYLERRPIAEIAHNTGLSVSKLRTIIKQKSWSQLRDESEAEAIDNFKKLFVSQVIKNRISVVSRHLKISSKLDRAVYKHLNKAQQDSRNLSPDALLSLSRAAKSSADIAARAVGLSDKIDPLQEQANQQIPTIIVIPNSSPKPIKNISAQNNILIQDSPLD